MDFTKAFDAIKKAIDAIKKLPPSAKKGGGIAAAIGLLIYGLYEAFKTKCVCNLKEQTIFEKEFASGKQRIYRCEYSCTNKLNPIREQTDPCAQEYSCD
ncbi:MAG: hypothetical protein HY329_09540 [Chloroflexi bacterium]|nr:hypothetical protein [Chloroflexota bacterium]